MNKNPKSKKILPSARKRTIPQSEEDFSDRRSTSSSDSASHKELTGSKTQNQRSTRRTPRKRYSNDFESESTRQLSSGSDPEWEVKGSADDNSSDSDPAWIPEGNVPTPVKQMIVEKKSTRQHNTSVKATIKDEQSSNLKVENISDESILKPSADPDGLLCFTALIPIAADAALDKGFESGKFIILKTDLKTQNSPSIWRIDGKNLLQKYEPIVRNNVPAYRNISTYSSWMATNKGLYVPIDVEFIVQSKSETIVTFDRTKVLLPVQSNILESLNEESTSMVDSFQIYLQTLISQSLDSNFLNEIVRENDTYFLESLAMVENHWILPKRSALKETIKLKKSFQELLETRPVLELRCVTSGDKSCDVCNGRNPTRSFDFQPTTYNFETLECMESKSPTKIYRLCLACADRVILYHQLYHIRYELYKICQTKINDFDLHDVPAAITACLEDDEWKSLMHRKVFLMLAEAQQVVCQLSPGSINA